MLKRISWSTVLLIGSIVIPATAAERTIERIEGYQQNGKNVVLIVLASTPLTEDVTAKDTDLHLILVADASTGRPLKLATVAGSGNTITITLADGESLDLNSLLLIRFDRVPFGAKTENTVDIKETALKLGASPGAAPPKTTLKAADGKNDALFYFDGEISHVRKGAVLGSYDLKLNYLTYKNFLGMVIQEGPLYTLQGGDEPKADPDSMQLGWNVIMPILIGDGTPNLFTGLLWEHTPQIESTRDFTYSNFVYSSVFRLVSRAWTSSSGQRVYFRPYFGVDVGRNLSTTVATAKDQTILRPLTGVTLNMVLFKMGAASVSVSGDYVRRWPINNEVLLSTNSSGNLVIASAGTKPRDHIKSGLAVDFTKFASLSINYERGSLPPAFQFVDNKWTLSLVIKAKK